VIGQVLPSGNISVREVFKGEMRRGGSLPLDIETIGEVGESLVEWEEYIIFLTRNGEEKRLTNRHQSVFRMCCCYFRPGFPAVHERGTGFSVSSSQLSGILRTQIENGFSAPQMAFETRRFETGGCCIHGINLPDYPAIITSVAELAQYLSHYDGLVNFGMENYTQEFFYENFIISILFSGVSSSTGFRVDGVLENGDIHISVFDRGVHTDDVTGIHVLIYVCNSHIPERFNLRTASRWF
jgi:hypothetical protein